MSTPESGQPEALSPEEQAEVERLGHGVAALKLFERESDRESFIKHATPRDSEFRAKILAGPSYEGDEAKLDRALTRAKHGLPNLRRDAMKEHAAYLGIDARIEGREVKVGDDNDRKRLMSAHGKWRQSFALPYRTEERKAMRQHLEGQIEAITGIAPNDAVELKAVKDQKGQEILYGPKGTYVNIEERARLLVEAINIMCHRSMLSGFGLANKTDHHSPEIWERYEDGTPVVEIRAANKRERQLEEVRRLFWKLSGFQDLRPTGVMKEEEFKDRSRKMWEDFTAVFEHPPNQKNRVAVRKQLKKILPEFKDSEPKEVAKQAA